MKLKRLRLLCDDHAFVKVIIHKTQQEIEFHEMELDEAIKEFPDIFEMEILLDYYDPEEMKHYFIV